jgi:hypothetical protein
LNYLFRIKKPEEPEFDIQGYLDEQFGELGSNVTGQLSQFQDLLSQMKSQKADQIDGAQKADQSDGEVLRLALLNQETSNHLTQISLLTY